MDRVVHFEIPFDNKQRAMQFYADTFGWQLTEMPQMSYVMARTVDVDNKQMPKEPGAINGGMFPRPQEAPNPTIYLAVSSIDATLTRVAAAGGRVVTPHTPIPGMGAYARVADTEGNVIGVFQSQQPVQQPSRGTRRASRPRRRAATRSKASKTRQAGRGRAKAKRRR